MLVNQVAAMETVKRECGIEWMWLVMSNGVGKYIAGTRRGLEAACAPAAIEVQPLDLGLADNRAGVRRGIDDAAPLAVHAHAREHRE